MTAIQIRDLCFTYPGADRATLNHINLEIEKGDFLAIVGNNGCGKSTFCKVLNGLIPHFISGTFSGEVLIDGINTLQADVGTLACRAGYVYQDFENQIVRPTVLDDASYACLNYGMADYRQRGLEALEKCGLQGKEQEYVWQLSGGQTHLLALAGAVALGPDILILDEPIAQLDPMHADQIYEVLKLLNEQHGKTIIVIEHHTEYIAEYCRHVLLLRNGEAAWMLPAAEALTRVDELCSSNIFPPQVTQAAEQLRKEGLLASDCQLPATLDAGLELFSRLHHSSRKENRSRTAEKKEECMVQFDHVSAAYRSVKDAPRQIFSRLNLEIQRGEKIALIGSNGAGKSTLMKLMTGLLKPSEGQILLEGRKLQDYRMERLSRQISLVYQNPEQMFIKDSVYADIAYAMQVRGERNWKEKTEELLKRFHLTEVSERDGRLLSGGQMRRASLAIGVALQPELLLLDEPTANLDIATRKEIMRTLQEMKEITETVLIATHDMQLVCEWAERIIVLTGGQVAADGTRDDIFMNQELCRRVGIRPPEIFTMGRMLDQEAACYTIQEFTDMFRGGTVA